MSRTHRPRGEGGFTLIEVMITTAILATIIAIMGPLLVDTLGAFGHQTDQSNALDQAQLLMEQIEHDVYAASVVIVVPPPNNALELITVVPSTNGGSDVSRCVEYRETTQVGTSAVALQRLSWTLNTAPEATSKWPVTLGTLKLNTTGAVAGYVIPNNGQTLFTAAGPNNQSVAVDLQAESGNSSVIELKTTATGAVANISGTSGLSSIWSSEC
ncbi:MAG TPA: type II secretion system protein [Acidimicrobiales bacterium]|nr:type II secretion system protein [Acidimicrobiales bacterium]